MKTCAGCKCFGCIKTCKQACDICRIDHKNNCPVSWCADRVTEGKQLTIYDYGGFEDVGM